MMKSTKLNLTAEEASEILALYEQYGSERATAKALGWTRGKLVRRLRAARDLLSELADGQLHAAESEILQVPKRGVNRFILTSAQNNTFVNQPLWENILALAAYYDAEIYVSRFTYNRDAYSKKSVKPDTNVEKSTDIWYDPAIEPYVNDKRIQLAPGLVWCGEINIIPTASNPLTGFETYTGRQSGIFPHVRFSLRSIASGKYEATKFNYTTGTVTQRNYIQMKAGLKAEMFHGYGALLVEVDSEGEWFVRQLEAGKHNELHDLNLRVENGIVETDQPILAITWGDIHAQRIDKMSKELGWGEYGMIDQLRPQYQFIHDLIDFRSRNHHDIKNPHVMFERYVSDEHRVDWELQNTVETLQYMVREFCTTIVVHSNHDAALEKWLREADYKVDPVNAVLFLELQLAKYKAIQEKDSLFYLPEYALKKFGCPEEVRFLRPDESYVVADIEHGMHGHLGLDGARGSAKMFSKLSRAVNIGHSHKAEITDDVFVAGVTGQLDLEYNVGPSAWSHSHILTYPNGTRTILTMWRGKWHG